MKLTAAVVRAAMESHDLPVLLECARRETDRLLQLEAERAAVMDGGSRWSEHELAVLRSAFDGLSRLDSERGIAAAQAKIKRTRAAVYRMAKNKGYIT